MEPTREFYRELVPKDREGNSAWRKGRLDRCVGRVDRQNDEREMCRQDLLYWVNTYCSIAEQRTGAGHVVIPFVTFEFQNDALTRMETALGRKIVVGDKSRDVGFTWMVIALFLHRWLFHDFQALGLGSRTEKLVDSPNNPDSLFWKFDFLLDHLPEWMIPNHTRSRLNRFNRTTNSDVTGYATAKDMLRGGRRLAIMLDELAAYDHKEGVGAWASCESATNTIIAVSTHQGTSGIFADACKSAKQFPNTYEYIQVRWWQDSRKTGASHDVPGVEFKTYLVKPEAPHPLMSQWTLDNRAGQHWSPWYEWKCERLHFDKKRIAEEIDGDPSAAGGGFFSKHLIDEAMKTCRPPFRGGIGRLIYDRETLEPIRFVEDPKGPLRLWTVLGANGRPVQDDYAIGADVSAGVGATPSVLAVGNKRTGERIAEWVDANRAPPQFAEDSIAICKFFHNAQLIWESSGGSKYTTVMRERGYRNVYYRKTNEDQWVPLATAHIGFSPSPRTTLELFEDWRDALGSGDYVERSADCLAECGDYRYALTGGVEHDLARKTDDPTKNRHNHGDRVAAAVLMWKLIKESRPGGRRPSADDAPPTKEIRPGSIAWFHEQDRRKQAALDRDCGLMLR